MKPAQFFAVGLVLVVAACSSSPTAPPPNPTITASTPAVSLERTATTQVTATSMLAGISTDITASATWRSSNEQVARVVAGVITGVGPGSATVTIEQGGASHTLTVTVRRRVYLTGEVKVTDGRGGIGGIAGLTVLIDDQLYGGRGLSNPNAIVSAPFGSATTAHRLAPGTHRFDLQIPTRPGDAFSDYPFTITFDQVPRVVDLDTGEQVGTVALENRSGMYPDNATVTWTFTLGAFTS